MFFGCRDFGFSGFGGYWDGLFMSIIPLALVGIIVFVVFKMLNQYKYSEVKNNNSQAMNILMDRYARGEISEEEYLSKKKLLRS